MNKKILRIILISLLAAVFAVSMGMVIFHQIESQKAIDAAEDAARIAGLNTGTATPRPETAAPTAQPPSPPPDETPEPPPEETPEPPPEETAPPEPDPLPLDALPGEARELAGLDLDALRAVNTDVVGWISIPGTVVSYPLMQGTDNEYYLSHNWKKEYSYSGSLMMAYYADRAMTDFHTIVYGHHMRNETMLGSLKHYFGNPDYWKSHPSVYIVLDDMIYQYDIFSMQRTAVNGNIYRLDLEENHLEQQFIQYCINHSLINTGVVPAPNSRILTLSTCTGDLDPNERWVVQGYLAQRYIRDNT